MAVVPAKLTRRRVFAAKAETTTGTDATLAAADGIFNAYDHEMKLDMDMVEREGQSAFSPLPSVHGGRKAVYTFKTSLTGRGGSTATEGTAERLLPACGFQYSAGVCAPVTATTSYVSLTMGHYQDGLLFKALGCVGKVKFPFKAGEPCMPEWEFNGVWQPPTDVALITPTYPTLIPPRFASATFTYDSVAYKISELEIEIDNELTMREDATAAAGFFAGVITNRRIKVSFDPEHPALATKDFWAAHLAHTEAALAVTLNGGTNNTVAFALPKLQPTKVEGGDRDGLYVNKLEFQANRSAAAGDDEMTITFS